MTSPRSGGGGGLRIPVGIADPSFQTRCGTDVIAEATCVDHVLGVTMGVTGFDETGL